MTSQQFQKKPAATSTPQTSLSKSRPFQAPATQSESIDPVQMKVDRDSNGNPSWWSRLQSNSSVPPIQAKLTVGAPNDVYEQEADRVADQVVSMPDAAVQQPVQREAMPEEEEVQTKPLAAGITPLVQREAMPGEEEVQTKAIDHSIQREELPEEEPVQAKAELSIQREEQPEEEEVQTKPIDISSANPASLQQKCSECEQEQVQRSGDGKAEAGGDVESRLNSSKGGGSPLSDEVRLFMEPRFGADFSQVRFHTDSTAIQMNRDLSAQAFTHKQDVYFGAGKAPAKDTLTAHELTHVVQQRGPVAQLQRACLPAADCATPSATLENFVKETESKPENLSKANKRKKACGSGGVPKPTCTSDGHGAKATGLTALVQKHYTSRLGYISGIFVDKDIPADYGAVTYGCAGFTPPLPGDRCTFVPASLEAQAKQYQAGQKSIGGESRQNWLTSTLGVLTHETEHARFDAAAPIAEPSATACKFADQESNLSEMASHLSQMHVYYRAALARPDKNRFTQFYRMFDYWVKNGSEDINGIVKDLRCKCECSDADHYIIKTAESVSSSQKWDTNELSIIHNELRNPKWGLSWPVAPPATINITDLPNVKPAPFKLE